MATETASEPAAILPAGYPFHIGTRLVNHLDADGDYIETEQIPLTEEDFLHPQEEDRFMATDAHFSAVEYLKYAIAAACRDKKGIRVFAEHRIDWQVEGIEPHGPDIAVFEQFTIEWDSHLGTLPVADSGAEIVAVFEVTSPSTRKIDLSSKFDEYARVGVPYYVIVDIVDPDRGPNIRGYFLKWGKYVPMLNDSVRGYSIPELKLWFRYHDGKIIASDEFGVDVLNPIENIRKLEGVRELAKSETVRANTAEATAVSETERANAETARADALAQELADLKAKLNEAQ